MALNGQPVPNSPVSLWSNGRQVASATTDGQGVFTLTLPAGTYNGILACGSLGPPISESVTVVAHQTTQPDIGCDVP
jgi:hypothetical protein